MLTVTVDYPDKTYCVYDFETMEEAQNWASNMYSPDDYTVCIEGVEYVK